MSSSTSLVSGLSSGVDWETMVKQLIAIDHRRVDLIASKQAKTQNILTEWRSLNSKLLALKTAAENLSHSDDFAEFKPTMTSDSATVNASHLLNVTTASSASIGSYTLQINKLAAAQKLSSGSFLSLSDALGSSYQGDIIINGSVVSISATDTLINLRDKINNLNSGSNPTGVTAGIIAYGTGDYRLLLSSDNTGAQGISMLNGGASDLLNCLGFTDAGRTVKNHITGGDLSDRFSNSNISIQSLLGLTYAETSGIGDIFINGRAVDAIDLSTDTLSSLQTKLIDAGLNASIITESDNNRTYYRLIIQGAENTYVDKNNILETLGFIKGGVSVVYGVSGDVANTSKGALISADTLIKDIDGYTGYLNTDYIHLAGTDTNGNVVSDDTFTISDTTTVGALLTKIQSLFGDVTASVTGAGKLLIVDNTPGTSSLSVEISVKDSGGEDDNTLNFDSDGNIGSASTIRKREIVVGADASLTIDGVTVTRANNTIDDILIGVTLDLLKADMGTTITLNIGRDIDAIMAKIQTFVSNYNNVSNYIHTQFSYDSTEQKTGGILFGDGTLSSVRSDLTSILLQSVWGVSSGFSTLGLVGISVDTKGQLSIDTNKLNGYLKTNFNDILKLFTANAETSIGTLSYISHGMNTKQGEYTVYIESAATRSTSTASDNTILSGDETLTISSGINEAVINLTSSMPMAQIVNAINSELSTVYHQVIASEKQLYSDSGQTDEITSATKWNSIYAGTGASAGLVDGDVISFSGTLRNGSEVSGSYTIDDVTEDSVQGLLSAIETSFSNQVTAAVNSNGRIIISDKTSGNSNVSLSFDCAKAHDLDFGSVLTANTDGQTGRYAMTITASADSGNRLIITHDDYGSGKSFTIHQQNNLLWTDGDQTVDNGLDVSGTINGEEATGIGQTLTGNSDSANVAGLSIKYTGTAEGLDAGTIKLIFGAAELYDRVLFNITDAYEGYVAYKQESLQNSITRYRTQIEEMEARLALKRERMINEFIRMELALQKIQSQSSWLTNQLNAVSKIWND